MATWVKHPFKAFYAYKVLYEMNVKTSTLVKVNFSATVQKIYCQCQVYVRYIVHLTLMVCRRCIFLHLYLSKNSWGQSNAIFCRNKRFIHMHTWKLPSTATVWLIGHWGSPRHRFDSIDSFSKCPKTTIVYLKVTKRSSCCSAYDGRKGGSQVMLT